MIKLTNEDLLVLLTILKGDKMEKYGVDKSSQKDDMEKVAQEKLVSKVWKELKEEKNGKTKESKK